MRQGRDLAIYKRHTHNRDESSGEKSVLQGIAEQQKELSSALPHETSLGFGSFPW